MRFTKMHGAGNDFVVLDARGGALPPLHAGTVRALADRQTGIGCDQLLLLEPSDLADLNAEMKAAGAWVFSDGLSPASTATVVPPLARAARCAIPSMP